MRENKLLTLVHSIIGETKDYRSHTWSQQALQYFDGNTCKFLFYGLLGWVLLSVTMLYFMHRIVQGKSRKIEDELKKLESRKWCSPVPEKSYNRISVEEKEPNECEEDAEAIMRKLVADNLRSINKNMEEFYELVAKDQSNRAEIARETSEVAELLHDYDNLTT